MVHVGARNVGRPSRIQRWIHHARSGSVKMVIRDSAKLITDGRMRGFMRDGVKPRVIFTARQALAQREQNAKSRSRVEPRFAKQFAVQAT